MHEPESILMNEVQKIMCYFEALTYHLIPVWKPGLINKKNILPSRGYCRSDWSTSENKRKQEDKEIFGPYQTTKETKKEALRHKVDRDTNCSRYTRWKKTGGCGSQRKY